MTAFHPIPDVPASNAEADSCRSANAPVADIRLSPVYEPDRWGGGCARMNGETEFQKLGVPLKEVRSCVTEEGSSGAVILTAGAALIVEHSAERAAAVASYLQSMGIPIYGYEDDIPGDAGHDNDDVTVDPV